LELAFAVIKKGIGTVKHRPVRGEMDFQRIEVVVLEAQLILPHDRLALAAGCLLPAPQELLI
jgi:hypothetical protein